MKLKELGRTELGECYVYTRSRRRLYGDPLTKVVPTHYSELGDFGLKIHWRTNDAAELRTLHGAVLKLLKEPGGAENFLEIKTALRASRKLLDQDQIENAIKAKSAQMFLESKTLRKEETELVAANLQKIS